MLKVSLAFVCAALMVGSAAAADIPEGSQLVTRAKDLAVVDGGNKVFTGKVKIQALSEKLPGMPVAGAYVIFEPGPVPFGTRIPPDRCSSLPRAKVARACTVRR